MKFKIYILYSAKADKYYIGQTEDVTKRLSEHNIRKNLGSDDWVLKYMETAETRSASVIREQEIKKKKSRKYIEWLIAQAG